MSSDELLVIIVPDRFTHSRVLAKAGFAALQLGERGAASAVELSPESILLIGLASFISSNAVEEAEVCTTQPRLLATNIEQLRQPPTSTSHPVELVEHGQIHRAAAQALRPELLLRARRTRGQNIELHNVASPRGWPKKLVSEAGRARREFARPLLGHSAGPVPWAGRSSPYLKYSASMV